MGISARIRPHIDLPHYYTVFLTKSQVSTTKDVKTAGPQAKTIFLAFCGFYCSNDIQDYKQRKRQWQAA